MRPCLTRLTARGRSGRVGAITDVTVPVAEKSFTGHMCRLLFPTGLWMGT